MDRVIFACVHNAGRSQMAAAFFAAMADPAKAVAVSAGTRPADRVHPEVVEAMAEAGIDLSAQAPQKLTDALAREAALVAILRWSGSRGSVMTSHVRSTPNLSS